MNANYRHLLVCRVTSSHGGSKPTQNFYAATFWITSQATRVFIHSTPDISVGVLSELRRTKLYKLFSVKIPTETQEPVLKISQRRTGWAI